MPSAALAGAIMTVIKQIFGLTIIGITKWLSLPLLSLYRYRFGERYYSKEDLSFSYLIIVIFGALGGIGIIANDTLVTGGLFTLFSVIISIAMLFHLSIIFIQMLRDKGENDLDTLELSSSAGTSWLWTFFGPFLSRIPRMNEQFLQRYIEPLLTMLLGILIIQISQTFGLFLFLSGLAFQVYEYTLWLMQREAYLERKDARKLQRYYSETFDQEPSSSTASLEKTYSPQAHRALREQEKLNRQEREERARQIRDGQTIFGGD